MLLSMHVNVHRPFHVIPFACKWISNLRSQSFLRNRLSFWSPALKSIVALLGFEFGSGMPPGPTIFVQAGTRIKLSWDGMSQLYSSMKYWRARLASLASKSLGFFSRQNSTISRTRSPSTVSVSVDFWPPLGPRVCLLLRLIGRSQEIRA